MLIKSPKGILDKVMGEYSAAPEVWLLVSENQHAVL